MIEDALLTAIYKEYYNAAAYYIDFVWGKSRNYLQPMWSIKYDGTQITDYIYISDLATAFNKEKLKEQGITHILNLVLGIDSVYPTEFIYKNIPTRDVPDQDLTQYFDECLDFMREAIESGGKVLVHCSYGVSRSASVVIAYLIKYHQMSYDEAYQYTKNKRRVIEPNNGFKRQLQSYSEQLEEVKKNF